MGNALGHLRTVRHNGEGWITPHTVRCAFEVPYNVRIQESGQFSDVFVFDLDEHELHRRIVSRWRLGQALLTDSGPLAVDDQSGLVISRCDRPAAEIAGAVAVRDVLRPTNALKVIAAGVDVTHEYIHGLPGAHADGAYVESAGDLVTQICRGFPALVRSLRERSHGRDPVVVTDEYDVQYLLAGVLRMFFDDVREEEPGPSHGAARPRADFFLAREGIVIETKMIRAGLTANKLQKELADDFEHYRRLPDCRMVIVLVYDAGGSLLQGKQLENDLSGNKGGFVARVLVP